jgi:hypothetical protein
MGALSVHREPATVTQAPIATEIHEPFDVHAHFAAKVTFHLERAIDRLTDFGDIHFAEPIRIHARIQTGFVKYLPGSIPPYSVDICQRYFQALVFGKVNPRDTRHDFLLAKRRMLWPGLALALLMLRVFADYPNRAFSFNDFALVTNSLD